MVRKVFFSFDYDDVMRANVVRNSDIVKRRYTGAIRFYDKSLWETAKKQGVLAIKRLINRGLDGSSVTCVLVGQHTWSRPWVRYELLKSFERGNGILAINIHNVGIGNKRRPGLGALAFPGPGATFLSGAMAGAKKPAPTPRNILAGLIAPKREPTLGEIFAGLGEHRPGSTLLTGSGGNTSALASLLTGYDPPTKKTPLANALAGLGQPRGPALQTSTLGSIFGAPPHRGATLLTSSMPASTPGLNPLDYVGYAVNHWTGRVELLDFYAGKWRVNPHLTTMRLADVKYPLGAYSSSGKFSNLFPIYNWKADNGWKNFPTWVEASALQAGR